MHLSLGNASDAKRQSLAPRATGQQSAPGNGNYENSWNRIIIIIIIIIIIMSIRSAPEPLRFQWSTRETWMS